MKWLIALLAGFTAGGILESLGVPTFVNVLIPLLITTGVLYVHDAFNYGDDGG